ncbi:DUF6356 family protein [Phaeobacter sp. J2-8]|uniref:DUF6356 family protein n=1 Tax=Phaeobacter sp. J2-8 TaxID=2931394 RepID=UPI0032AEBB77
MPSHGPVAFFTAHPASVNESYGQHLRFALRFSGLLFLAAGAALVHAILPRSLKKPPAGLSCGCMTK